MKSLVIAGDGAAAVIAIATLVTYRGIMPIFPHEILVIPLRVTRTDNGGALEASEFAVGVNGKNVSPSIFQGSEVGTTTTMSNGLYSVTELPVEGYSVSFSPGCSGRIHTGQALIVSSPMMTNLHI